MSNSPQNAKSIWDKFSEWWIRGIGDDESSEYVEIIVPLVEGILSHKKTILDVGTGTGRLAQEAGRVTENATIVGGDISIRQLRHAKEVTSGIRFVQHSIEQMPFKNEQFDHVFISFGFRNFSDKSQSLLEIKRVLKKAGVLHILEFSKVENKTFSKIYDFYSYNFIPLMGQAISGDKKSYDYLVKSIRTHENQEDMLKLFNKAGFKDNSYENMFNGIVSLHRGRK